MNGAKNLTTSSNFTLSTSPATGNLTCQNDANQTITSGSLLAYPLAPGANITCYLAVIVSSSHQSAGKITGFPVTASFTGGEGLYVVPLASTVDVPVAAGAAAGVPTASFPLANATLKNFIAGVATAVEGKLPKLGAPVTYSVTITNGAMAVSTGNNFTFSTTPAYDANSLECNMLNSSSMPAPVVHGEALPASLAANANITCSFTVTVTTAHQAIGAIPAITVNPGFVSSSMDYALSVAPSSSAAVAVASGISLAAASTFATSVPSIAGE
ncbi:hypothetical protein OEZ85_003262 [Tetradesmus obliquus]|uniref:DUF11 domain-containing protein n=1 Tax=Tetradesmus obliquus TaxID=3088 RepID=A0ABY8U537_TETOB|nr:hypothetical protein OEZ85_003262 [Tetradesmus obliquus]